MDIKFDMNGFRAQITARQDKMRAATRPAAQAGVQVIYEAARLLCPVAESAHYFYGTLQKKPALRAVSSGQPARLDLPGLSRKTTARPRKAVYHISWNVHIGTDRVCAVRWMVELGTSRTRRRTRSSAPPCTRHRRPGAQGDEARPSSRVSQ
jgi:hypothetical protein